MTYLEADGHLVAGGEITCLLTAVRAGDSHAETRLAELVYRELHFLAQRHMRRERSDHTLQPTALVNETYLRMLRGQPLDFQSRVHFYAAASMVMRRILVDHARQRGASKRPAAGQRIDLLDILASTGMPVEELLILDQALDRLAEADPRQARLVELRYFGGLTEEESALALGLSVRTVKRDWSAARAWLQAEINRQTA